MTKIPENLTVLGNHDYGTIEQMINCLQHGNAAYGVLCADGHLGYAQPVGGVIAYKDQISISGVGFDIACGNMAMKLDVRYSDIAKDAYTIGHDIQSQVSFGLGRKNEKESVDADFFDDKNLWKAAGTNNYKALAQEQLGTVGGGNHYVDIFEDEDGMTWIGVHFGSRGLGHKSASKYLKDAGGKDGMNVAPALVDINSDLGQRYLHAMELAGKYAYAGREWVTETVRKIIGGREIERIHNHHNYAWVEEHFGEKYFVIRKGATPAFPGQKGFVGGSMGDDAVIIEGIDSEQSRKNLYSTIHGAGRLFSRSKAKKTFTTEEMEKWLGRKGVITFGGDLDESPMAYRRLSDVLYHHTDTVKVLHTLRPKIVVMAGKNEHDPFKD
jgi:tRNA-splicing ligase RtcB